VVDDLDADGTTDLLIAVDAIQNSATGLPGHVMLAGIPPSSANGPAPIAFIDGYLEDGGQNSTTNAFVRIDPANIPALANATHYELTIWRQVDTPLSLDPAVVSYTRHPVVAGQPTLALKVRLPWPSTTPKSCFGANTYWFDLRRIVFDNNAITAGGARCFGGFAGDYDKIVAMRTNETMYSYIASAVPIVNFPETLGQLAAACTTIAPSDGTTPTPIIINRRKPPPVPQNPQMPALTSGSTYNYPPPPP
jgi:hypothetical protein